MNIYNNLNKMIDYIEDNLEQEIDNKKLAMIVGVNVYTLQRLFPLISNVTINEYIRKRRLTVACTDLVQNKMKIMDVAIKYGYDSATSFSRAFESFHGVKPGQVKESVGKLKYYPKLEFEIPEIETELDYEIVELEGMRLYGIGVKTNQSNIKKDAPNLFVEVKKTLSMPDYGMVVYNDRVNSDEYEYWVLWKEKQPNTKEIKIEKSKWLKFKIDSQDEKDIQAMSDRFYLKFLPTCEYKIREMPELEYYHDGVTEFLVPIN
ncbi:MAG: AraC family transcriptional regulator [Bacilli bacterium]|nr:AraC family transcriptional regulator [Bacilli bacterium]